MECETPRGNQIHLSRLLTRAGMTPDFAPNPDMVSYIQDECKILVVGAGGLGCEVLKCLAMTGFKNVHVIDMDTIDLSNLNRQFLFRKSDIGKAKAEAAVATINKKIPGFNYVAHYKKIQDYDEAFYSQFNIVICGLDSVEARRWINSMLLGIALQAEDESRNIIPLIDGGTEGFKGHCRVILPTMTACIECNMDLYPPQQNYPMCTIANTPRLPEHCVEYAKVIQWPQEHPFGEGVAVDGDNPQHVMWLFRQAFERANSYSITGVTYRLTQGVTKRIIPAVASTNASIAALCVTEALKLATSSYPHLNNYMMFNNCDGVYTFNFESEKQENCLVCSRVAQVIKLGKEGVFRSLLDHLAENPLYNIKSPSLTAVIGGESKTLYVSNIPALEEQTRPNLDKSWTELGLGEGQEVLVTDPIFKLPVTFKLSFE